LEKIRVDFENPEEPGNSIDKNSYNIRSSISNIIPKSYYNPYNKLSSNSNLFDNIKELNAFFSKKDSNLNNFTDTDFNIQSSQNKILSFDENFFNKLSSLLHDFKHVVYDNMIYFDNLVIKYIHPLIIAPDSYKDDMICNNSILIHLERSKLKDELNYLSVMKDFTISLILNITNFMSKNEFLSGNLDEQIDIIGLIDLMVKIFNRRLEYDNALYEKIISSQRLDLNFNENLQTNFTNNKKRIKIYSKFNNIDNISKIKIISNKNLVISLLYNFISNSYKYTDKGEILIEADICKINKYDYVLIKICDTGKGIPQEILNNWGKPFNLQDKTLGTGLGQFLIDSISKKLGFKILKPEINHFRNTGTVFKILIPVSKIITNIYDSSKEILNNTNTKCSNLNMKKSNASILNKSSISQDLNLNMNNYESKKTLFSNKPNFKDVKNTVMNNNSLVSLFFSKSDLNSKTNDEMNVYDSHQKLTTELENFNLNIDENIRRLSLFNNLYQNDLKSFRSVQDINISLCDKNSDNRRNSTYLKIIPNQTKDSNRSFSINSEISIKNNYKDKNSIIVQKGKLPIKNTTNSMKKLKSTQNNKFENKTENLKVIYILCLDDESIFLRALEKKLRNIAINLKKFRFELIFINCLQDFFRVFLDLLFKNIIIDFFIMDQNISHNMRGVDCCKIANEFYKLYLKDNYAQMNFHFFFVTEEANLLQFRIIKSKKNLVMKEHIYGKIQLNLLCEKLIEYLDKF